MTHTYEEIALIARIISPAIKRNQEMAQTLVSCFGNASRTMHASRDDLMSVQGMNTQAIEALHNTRDAAITMLRLEVNKMPVLSSWSALLSYAHASLAHSPVEQLRVLYLDRKNKLLMDETPWQGAVDHTPMYVKEIMRRALQVRASAIIVLHNHPSGDPTPSQADIVQTRALNYACKLLDVTLHDHLVMANSGHTSFRSAGLL